jgi:hypothetical protein
MNTDFWRPKSFEEPLTKKNSKQPKIPSASSPSTSVVINDINTDEEPSDVQRLQQWTNSRERRTENSEKCLEKKDEGA